MTKRHFEPIVWLLFSGGGVVASVFLPILIVLFGLAIPLGWVQPDYDQLHAVVKRQFGLDNATTDELLAEGTRPSARRSISTTSPA